MVPQMLSATELRFSTRERGDLPAWILEKKSLRMWSLADAKTVTLRAGSVNVLVKVREQSSLFVGEIVEVEPGAPRELQRVRVGELIVFTKAHIFT